MRSFVILLWLLCPPVVASARADTYYMYVMNEPAPERDTEYNDWYNQHHAPDVVSIPGFVSAQRYVAHDHQLRVDFYPPRKYLIEFKIVTDDLEAVLAEVRRRIRDHVTVMSDVIGPGSKDGIGFTYHAITGVVRGRGGDVGVGNAPRLRYLQIEFATAAAGKEAQFNDWYNRVHAPSVASAPGFQNWQRLELSPAQLASVPNGIGPYLIRFEIETRDIDASFARLKKVTQANRMSELGDRGEIGEGYTWRAIGPLLLGDEVRKQRAQKGCVIFKPTAPCL